MADHWLPRPLHRGQENTHPLCQAGWKVDVEKPDHLTPYPSDPFCLLPEHSHVMIVTPLGAVFFSLIVHQGIPAKGPNGPHQVRNNGKDRIFLMDKAAPALPLMANAKVLLG